jgi:hypothetical protein
VVYVPPLANNLEWLMKDELETMWMEAAVVYFKLVSRYSPVQTEENHENPQFGRSASLLRFGQNAF